MKYRLGHAIIEWASGGYSEALIYQGANGDLRIQCANWLGSAPLAEYESQFENVMQDHGDMYIFLLEKEND